jgi:hypothetical protein
MLHKTLMNDKTALELVKDREKALMDREVLRFISQRQCSAVRQEQCIVEKPKDLKDWCPRCIALDHLVNYRG